MRKNLTEIVFILDRSGSMSGLEADTIRGFNSMIEKQKKENGEALISTILFDNVSEVIHDRVPVQKVEPMTDKDYSVRGCTALLDAIGGAIHHIGNVHKYARKEDVPEHTLFVITTDGMENASRRYGSEKVKKMIERQKEKYGWEFLFLGANIDAVETAKHFGIGADRAVNYHSDREGTQLNYEVLSEAVSAVLTAACILHAIRCDDEQCVFRDIFISCVLVDIPNVMNRSADSIQKGGAAANGIVLVGHRLDPLNRYAVMNNLAHVVKEDGRDQCLTILFFLLFNHGVEASDGVCFQPAHRAAAIKNEYDLRQVLSHVQYLRI